MARTDRPPSPDVVPPALRSILRDLPVSRVAAAFERPIGARTLFAACVRAAVPFAVVDAIFQSRLKSAAGSLDACGLSDPFFALERNPRNKDRDTFDNNGGGDDESDHMKTDEHRRRETGRRTEDASWWVSCCGCLRRLACAPRYDADAYWCGGPCPRGWLRRIPSRDALRIVAWHWAVAVAARLAGPSASEGGHVLCRGLYERDWFHVAGHEAEWDYMGPDMSEPDAVVFDIVLGEALSSSMVPRSEVAALWTDTKRRLRVPHPTCSAVAVFVCYDGDENPPSAGRINNNNSDGIVAENRPASVVALVDGDQQFAGRIRLS
jgi:hypothetical protein